MDSLRKFYDLITQRPTFLIVAFCVVGYWLYRDLWLGDPITTRSELGAVVFVAVILGLVADFIYTKLKARQ